MKRLKNFISWIHSPELVWQFQNYFGIEKVFPSDDHEYKNGSISASPTNGYLRSSIANGSTKSASKKTNIPQYRIRSRFFYYLFKFGSFLGQEEFYVLFFPFWFWHFDGQTGRKLMFIWMVCMHIGQVLKDYLRLQRPKSPPVIQLEDSFLCEYGMPSTHATVAFSIPFSVMFLQSSLCQFPLLLTPVIVTLWATLVCLSRIYMGVHSFLEIVAGLTISIVVTSCLAPSVDYLDSHFMTTYFGPILLFIISFFISFVYPSVNKIYSRSWSDAIAIASSTAGILCGSWMESHFVEDLTPPLCVFFGFNFSITLLFIILTKTMFGVFVILLAKIITQKLYDLLLLNIFGIMKQNFVPEHLYFFEVPRKFLSYFALGATVFLTPALIRCANYLTNA